MQNLDIALKNIKISALLPGTCLPPCGTALHTFVYCHSGSFLFYADGKCYIVRQNQLALLPGGQVSFSLPLPGDTLRVHSFPLSASCHDADFFTFFGLTEDTLAVDALPSVIDAFFDDSHAFSFENAPELAQMVCVTAAIRLCTFYLQARINAENDECEFKDVIQYMESHLDEDLSLDALSQRLHYNTVYFSQKFKEKKSISPMRYLAHLRICKAAQLLFASDMSVSAIGKTVGFASSYYFRTFFSKHVGLSPEDFRLRMKPIKA